jgi:hypothetical protein
MITVKKSIKNATALPVPSRSLPASVKTPGLEGWRELEILVAFFLISFNMKY